MPARTLKPPRQQEVEVGLLELELAGFFEPFDECVLELQLADEADAVAEAVRDEQHEAVEVEAAVFELALVEVKVHVAGDRRGAFGRRSGRRRLAAAAARAGAARGERHAASGRTPVFCHGFRM